MRLCRSQKFSGTLGPRPLVRGRGSRHRYTLLPTCVIVVLNFIAVGQTIWAYVEKSQKIGVAGATPTWDGAWLTPTSMPFPTYVTVPNLIVLHCVHEKSNPLYTLS